MLWLLFVLLLPMGQVLWADGAATVQSRLLRIQDRDRRYEPEILFQAFTWDAAVDGQKHVWYRHLLAKAKDLAESGVTHVWFPPVSRSVAPQGYMPGDYYDLGHGDALDHNRTLYGSREELETVLKGFKRKGMVCLADVVINHRCASHQENGLWNVFHHPSGKMQWEKWAIARGDVGGTGSPDSGQDFAAAPDIDHGQARVRKDIVDWLRWMMEDVGFDGWRFDFSKGYGPGFVRGYIERTDPVFAVGEYWTSLNYQGSDLLPNQDHHRQELCDWIDGTGGLAAAFDFTSKGLLQVALERGEYWRLQAKDGRQAGLMGWWPSRAVTFIDNHDTGSTQGHWPFPARWVLAGYAYILTHPGMPTIFWDHFYGWGDELHDRIRELARLRHELSIHRNSKLQILEARPQSYVAKVDDKVMLRLGHGHWSPGEAWRHRLEGDGWCIWSRN